MRSADRCEPLPVWACISTHLGLDLHDGLPRDDLHGLVGEDALQVVQQLLGLPGAQVRVRLPVVPHLRAGGGQRPRLRCQPQACAWKRLYPYSSGVGSELQTDPQGWHGLPSHTKVATGVCQHACVGKLVAQPRCPMSQPAQKATQPHAAARTSAESLASMLEPSVDSVYSSRMGRVISFQAAWSSASPKRASHSAAPAARKKKPCSAASPSRSCSGNFFGNHNQRLFGGAPHRQLQPLL
jgi:hypothetical protein